MASSSESNSPSVLPDELWLHIFQLCLSSSLPPSLAEVTDEMALTGELPTITTPFCLSVVSSDWRRVCLSNTSLWSSIYIWFKSSPVLNNWGLLRSQLDALKTWISRSGTRPLRMVIGMEYWDEGFDFAECPPARRIPQIITENGGRIQALDLAMSEAWYKYLEPNAFTELETLKVIVSDVLDVDKVESDWYFERIPVSSKALDFSRCKKLSSLAVTGMFEPTAAFLVPERWETVTDIAMSHVIPGDCIKALVCMPNLKAASFELFPDFDHDCYCGPEWTRDSFKPRTGPALQTLSLNRMVPAVMKSLLYFIPLSLKHLKLGRLNSYDSIKRAYNPRDYDFVFSSVPAFADTLQSLTLQNTLPHLVKPLIRLLPQLNRLISLEIINDWKDNAGDNWIRDIDVGSKDMYSGGLSWVKSSIDELLLSLVVDGTLPHLERFWCTILEMRMEDWALLAFLRHRTCTGPGGTQDRPAHQHCCRIRDVRLVSVQQESSDLSYSKELAISQWALEEMRTLKRNGLKIVVARSSGESVVDLL
ncbi:hypothetical protein DFP72DRAFT_893563, partial [Ephemerocybe angulata]